MGLVAGAAALGGGLAGMFGGGGASSVSLPSQIPTGGAIDTLTKSGPQSISSLAGYNLGGANLPQYSGLLQGVVNNPFASQAIGGAQGFGGAGQTTATQALGNAGALGAEVQPLLNQAFDPQGALFKRYQDLISQQTLAGLGQSGLASTPWGQGVYGNTLANFDIDWTNNLLNRMISGAGAATNLGAGAYNLGSGAASGGAGFAGLPYDVANTIGGNQLGALSGGAQYGSAASAVPQTGIGDWLSYLQGANQNNLGVANLALAQQQQGFLQNQAYGQGIGGGLGLLAGRIPGFGGGGGGGGWAGGGPGYFGNLGGTTGYAGPGFVSDFALV